MEKLYKPTLYKALWCIFLVGLMIILTQISFISALDLLPNVANFDKDTGEYGKYDIRNSILGIPFLQLDKVVELELKTNTFSCSNNCEATKEIILHTETSLVDDVRFFDPKKRLTSIAGYQVYYSTNETTVNDYEMQCSPKIFKNGTSGTECLQVLVGNHQEPNWIPYTLRDKLPTGTYQVKLTGSKSPFVAVDWQIKTNGIWTKQWADWGVTGLMDYHNTGDVSGEFMSLTSWRGMTFNASEDYTIQTVSLKLYRTDVVDTIWVMLRALNATSLPVGNANLSVGSYDVSGITTNTAGAWYNITMSGYELTEGTNYSIVAFSTVAGSNLRWRYGGDFARGEDVNSADGIAWSFRSDQDFVFEVWGAQFTTTNETLLLTPANDTTHRINTEINFSSSGQIEGNYYNLTNATYNIWYSNASLFNQTLIEVTGEVTNITNLSIDNFNTNNYYWNVEYCAYNLTDTFCQWGANNFTFEWIPINITTNTFNTTVTEGARESIGINYTAGETATSSTLIYNGTSYTGTTTCDASFNCHANVSLNIPMQYGSENKTWNWTIVLPSETYYTPTLGHGVNPMIFGLCNTTNPDPFINVTFENEADSSSENATIPTSDWVYYLDDIDINRTFTYINNTENPSYAFCFFPQDKTYNVDYRLQYASDGYPQRTYDPDWTTLTNTTTEITLQLLSSADGQYVTFQIINTAEQLLSGVVVNATREIAGVQTLVGEGTTGDDGTVTLWLNPDYLHTLTFVRSGYETYTASIYPTQTEYTINLGIGEADETTIDDYTLGITYEINPSNDTLLNATTYTFEFILDSDYWDVTEFGFVLRNQTDILDSTSESTNGGTADISLNTGNHTRIFMDYYWVISGNYTNGTRFWYVLSLEGSEWSLRTFFDDLRSYIAGGLFMSDDSTPSERDFTLAIILFLFIFVFTGVLSYKFGLVSPAAIIGFIFTLVAFLDFGLEIIPTILGVRGFPTFFIGAIMILILIREGIR